MGKNNSRMIALLIMTIFLVMSQNTVAKNLGEGDQYLAFAETMPEPVGGLKEIYSKIKYSFNWRGN